MFTQMKVRRIEEKEVDVPSLGARIEQARRASNKSLSELCREANVSRNYWYQLEAEEIKGALLEDTLRRIEKVLGIDFEVRF